MATKTPPAPEPMGFDDAQAALGSFMRTFSWAVNAAGIVDAARRAEQYVREAEQDKANLAAEADGLRASLAKLESDFAERRQLMARAEFQHKAALDQASEDAKRETDGIASQRAALVAEVRDLEQQKAATLAAIDREAKQARVRAGQDADAQAKVLETRLDVLRREIERAEASRRALLEQLGAKVA